MAFADRVMGEFGLFHPEDDRTTVQKDFYFPSMISGIQRTSM
jgi:hypothetical protein